MDLISSGKTIVMYFWSFSNPVCNEKIPTFEKLLEANLNAEFL